MESKTLPTHSLSDSCDSCVEFPFFFADTTSRRPLTYFHRTAGQTVTFPCISQSTDPADWWFHNGAAHQISSVGLIINSFKTDGRFALRRALSGDWSLIVSNVTESDSGVYICRTSQEEHFNLTVLRKYSSTTTTTSTQQQQLYCGVLCTIISMHADSSMCLQMNK